MLRSFARNRNRHTARPIADRLAIKAGFPWDYADLRPFRRIAICCHFASHSRGDDAKRQHRFPGASAAPSALCNLNLRSRLAEKLGEENDR